MNTPKDESITGLMNGIKKDADELLHTCPYCESIWTRFDLTIEQYWCNECQRWDDVGDEDEESREDIGRTENAVLDKENR